MSKEKAQHNRRRHDFLLDFFFEGAEGYATKELKDKWVLAKQWNGTTNAWEVAIWDKEGHGKAQKAYKGLPPTK